MYYTHKEVEHEGVVRFHPLYLITALEFIWYSGREGECFKKRGMIDPAPESGCAMSIISLSEKCEGGKDNFSN